MSRVASSSSLVIGYGNSLRGDDGVGPRVARVLGAVNGRRLRRAIACRQLTPELAEAVSRAGRVIFVDARAGSAPGRIAVRKAYPAHQRPPTFGHALSPEALLALVAAAYGRCPSALVVTLAGATFEHGAPLSPQVRAALPLLIARVRRLARPSLGLKPHAKSRPLGYNRVS